MGKCKTKAIDADLGILRHILAYSDIFRHNQAYSGIFRNYSGLFWALCNPDIFRILVYSESSHIQDQSHIQNPCISKVLAHSEIETYSESWALQNPRIIRTGFIPRTLWNIYNGLLEKQLTAITIFANYNHFCNITFSCPLIHKINMTFLMQIWFSLQKSLLYVKNYGSQGVGAGDHGFWYSSSTFYSDITYYFWLSTFTNLSTTS